MTIPLQNNSTVKNILYVDDDRFSRRLLEYFFEDSEIELNTAGNSTDFYQQLEINKPDVVLMDSQLGDESGVELTKNLLDSHPNLPVVFVSSNKFEAIFKDAPPTNVKGLIEKPFSPDSLLNTMQELLNSKQPLQAPKVNSNDKIAQLRIKYLQHLSTQLISYQGQFENILTLSNEELLSLKADAHKTAGTGGLHGFKELSQAARNLEAALAHLTQTANKPEEMNPLCENFEEFLQQIQLTLNSNSH